MSVENEDQPDGATAPDHSDEHEGAASDIGVSAETDAEGSSQTPEEKLERIAAEHDVPIEKDPKQVQAKAEATVDDGRDVRSEDAEAETDPSSEPPD